MSLHDIVGRSGKYAYLTEAKVPYPDMRSAKKPTSSDISSHGDGYDSLINELNSYKSLEKNWDAYSSLIEELESYKSLEENWDGYGGIGPSSEVIETVRGFIKLIKKENILKPEIMVDGEGSISLFWRSDDMYLETSFDEISKLTFLYKRGDTLIGVDDLPIKDVMEGELISYFPLNKSNDATEYKTISTYTLNKIS